MKKLFTLISEQVEQIPTANKLFFIINFIMPRERLANIMRSGIFIFFSLISLLINTSFAQTRIQFTTGTVNGTNMTMTQFASIPGNGNTIIAIISTRGTSANRVSSITQTGATWSRVCQSTNTNGNTLEIWYAPNINNAGNGITITLAASLRAVAVAIEYSGILSANSIDQIANAAGSGTNANTGTTSTTFQANELWLGGIGLINAGSTLTGISNGFSQVTTINSGAGPNGTALYALEKIVTSVGTANTGGNSSNVQWAGAIATFKAKASTTTSLTSSLNPSIYGNSVTFTASVTSSAATGTVTFMDGLTTLGSGTLASGTAVFSTATITVGSHTITAVYNGDGTYMPSVSSILTQVVNEPSSVTWNGSTSSDWNTMQNWTPTYIPSATVNVLIPTGDVAISAAGSTCNNLTMTTGATLTINSGGQLTVNGTFTKSSGNSDLLIKDGGSLIHNTAGIHGTAERNVTANAYHFLSSPVTSTTFGSVFPNNQNLIWAQVYDEPNGTWINKTISDALDPGTGYLVWIDPSIGNQIANFAGIFNTAAQTKTLSLQNNSGNARLVGWNLLGNPFPSGIDWDLGGWHGSNVDGSVYIWDGAGQQYLSWSGSAGNITDGVIPPQNGFFVKTNTDGSSMTIPTAARVNASQPLYKDLVPNILHLGITGNNFRDDTYIQFSPDATAGFDSQGDAYKLWGVQAAPQLYTIIPDDVLSINALPSVNEHPIVPVGLKVGAEGTYVITADGMDSFDPMIPIRLDDLKLGYTQDLRLNNTYSFTASPGDNENRFNIRFYSPVGIEEQPLMNLLVFNENNRISINNAGNYSGMIQVYNSAGQLIESRTMAPGIQKTAMLPPGLYIVKVITGKETDSRKVILF